MTIGKKRRRCERISERSDLLVELECALERFFLALILEHQNFSMLKISLRNTMSKLVKILKDKTIAKETSPTPSLFLVRTLMYSICSYGN